MELDSVIGTRLNEIKKTANDIKLVFEDTKSHKIYVLTFDGLLFESSAPTLNRRVRTVKLSNTLGFRAHSQLSNLNRDPRKYRQIFIEMEGSKDNNKVELMGALTDYRISLRR